MMGFITFPSVSCQGTRETGQGVGGEEGVCKVGGDGVCIVLAEQIPCRGQPTE